MHNELKLKQSEQEVQKLLNKYIFMHHFYFFFLVTGQKSECSGIPWTREPWRAIPGWCELQLCGSWKEIPTHGQLVWRRENSGSPSSVVCNSQVSTAPDRERQGQNPVLDPAQLLEGRVHKLRYYWIKWGKKIYFLHIHQTNLLQVDLSKQTS